VGAAYTKGSESPFLWGQRKYSSLQIVVLLSLHFYSLMVAQKSYESSVFSDLNASFHMST
jgi:hypothetical protein